MSIKKIHDEQPDIFEFNEKSKKLADELLKKYPSSKKKVR